jgi:pantothenate synthetase
LVEEETLQSIDDDFEGNALLLTAAWVGETRLIDNVRIEFE